MLKEMALNMNERLNERLNASLFLSTSFAHQMYTTYDSYFPLYFNSIFIYLFTIDSKRDLFY
jgi:hypothetical protein